LIFYLPSPKRHPADEVTIDYFKFDGQNNPLPEQFSFLTIFPEIFVLSALKKAEVREQSIILRFYNPRGKEEAARITANITQLFALLDKEHLPQARKLTAWRTNLDEERIDKLPVKEGKIIEINVKPYEIVTIELNYN
jgi:alpha-mannosidase